MNRRGIVLPLSCLLLLAAFPVAAQRNEITKEQEEARKREEAGGVLKNWPRDEVPYIIDSDEEAAFKRLQTDEERDKAIEQFWFRRDPTPDTLDNEYKDDYYFRIQQANEKFTSGIPGWKTDRGRIWVTYGEPDEIQTYATGGTYQRPIEEGGGVTNTFPFEKWRYRYIEGIGNNIELEFVDSSMSGEYRLEFDPSAKDALLHVPGVGLTEYEERMGLDKADRLNREHAAFGNPLGQDTRMSTFDRLQLATDIYRPPPVKYKDLEALVTSTISYNVLPFDVRADYLKVSELSVQVPITLQIQYKHLAFKEENGRQIATGRISGTIKDLTGRVKERIEDPIEVNLASALFRPDGVAMYQKILNLPPGLYSMYLLIEDGKTKNKGTITKKLEVKRFPEGNLSASSLILADVVEKLPPRTVSAQYQIGSMKVRPSVKNEFRRDQNMNVFLQVYGLKVDDKTHKPSVNTEVLITRDGQEVRKIVDDLSELASLAQQMNFIKQVPMSDFEPGEYAIQVRVKDVLADQIYLSSGKFTVQ